MTTPPEAEAQPAQAEEAAADVGPQQEPPRPAALGAAQRLFESVAVAVATSTGLYLVGTVYIEAYYGRMSIDATSLDFSPPYIALQSAHVLESLLTYPSTLIVFYLLYRALASRMGRVRSWFEQARQRLGRLFLLLVNLVIVSPLVVAAWQTAWKEGLFGAGSVLGEVGGLMGTVATILIIYLIWLSFGPRRDVISEIRRHQLIPIALIFALYLLDALVSTANDAALDAELLMTGQAASSRTVAFTFKKEIGEVLPAGNLILVTMRNSNYYVVEQQPLPPSQRPIAYVVPFGSVHAAQVQRINEAGAAMMDLLGE